MHAQIGDLDTWYEKTGTGEPLVLLHPGGADSRTWESNLPDLAEHFTVYAPDRRGHGRTHDVDGPMSYQQMADDTIRFIEQVIGQPARLLGCSDGTTVALLVALTRPDLVRQLVLVCGVFHRDGWVDGALDLDEASTEFLTSYYAEVSPHGREHFRTVLDKLDAMHAAEPTLTESDLARVAARTLVMVGDDDEVRLEHAIAMYRGIPDAELSVVPGASHGLLVEKPELCDRMIVDFLTKPAAETVAPIRRAASA